MQANEPVDVSIELHSLRQELKSLHKEVDTLAQGTDHPEVKRFAGGHHPIVCCPSVETKERNDNIFWHQFMRSLGPSVLLY